MNDQNRTDSPSRSGRKIPASPFRDDAPKSPENQSESKDLAKVEPAPNDPLKDREALARKTSAAKIGLGVGVAVGVATVGAFLLFRLLNRMKVEGLENIPEGHDNVLYCPNHSTLLDNFALGIGLYIPRMLFRPEYIPINLADRKNFFGDPSSRRFKDKVLRVLGEYFFKNLRAFPVDRGKGGIEQVDQWVEMLQHNIVIVFPEGTRSRTGEIGRGKAGVGKLIYESRPTVLPVRLIGMEEILGVGKLFPSFFHTVRIIIGKPLNLNELFPGDLPEDPAAQMEFYREIADRVVDAIRGLTPGKKLPMDRK